MATNTTPTLFAGGCTNEKAHSWFRTFQLGLKSGAADNDKRERFELSLKPGSEAEKWFEDLPVAEKDTWKKAKEAFEKKWPRPKATTRPNDAVIEDLQRNVLSTEMLGLSYEDDDGTTMQTHIAWAQRGRKLIGELGGDTNMLMLSYVRQTIPLTVRRYLPEATLTTWDAYFAAVEGLTNNQVKDAAEEQEKLDALQTSPGGLARSFGSSMTFNSPQRTPSRTPRASFPAARASANIPTTMSRSPGQVHQPNPFVTPQRPAYEKRRPWHEQMNDTLQNDVDATLRPNNLTQRLLAAASTPETPSPSRSPLARFADKSLDAELVHRIVREPRIFQNDASGQQQYHAAFTQWTVQNQNTQRPNYATFPFSPGTLPPGSGECYNCGELTNPVHRAQACETRTPVPLTEKLLRTKIARVVREQPSVFQVDEIPYDFLADADYDFDPQSGNGEEPAI